MTWLTRGTAIIGLTAAALLASGGDRPRAQGADPNAAPNPYKMQENWAQPSGGRKFGQAIKVQVDHSDGKSIWVFERCESNECTNSNIPPLLKFGPAGVFEKAFGADKFAVPHSLYVDRY